MDTQELLKRETRVNIEQWCRRNAQAVPMGDAVLCRVLGKYLMYANSQDESLAPHLALDGYWEIWITMAIAKYIQPGMRCLDVGANVGYYSVLLADWIGEKGEVVAFEPAAENLWLLERNLRRAGKHAQLQFVAAGSEPAMGKLYANGHRHGDFTMVEEDQELPPRAMISVRRIDDVVSAPVDFIKLDIEGSECAAWRGMREVLHSSPNVQIAAEWSRKYDPEYQLFALAKEDGFKPLEIMGDGNLRPIKTVTELADASVDWKMVWFKR